jgi:Spy/CpxP family protein refolding chaperone
MDKTARNKWQVRAAALVVFLLGFAAGALALNAYRSWAREGDDGPRGGGGRRVQFERMLERLELTGEQNAQVRQIFADAREQMRASRRDSEARIDEMRRQTDERLRAVLSPEQWQKFQQMKEEARAPRRGGGGRRGGDGGPPPRDER